MCAPCHIQGCQSGAMALKTAPVKISWRQGLLLQRQTTLQQAIMNCLTALSGHAANARCSTVAPRRREGGICTTDTPTCSQIRAHAHTAEYFFACAAPETVLALHFRPQRKKTLTPLHIHTCIQKSFTSVCFENSLLVHIGHNNPKH